MCQKIVDVIQMSKFLKGLQFSLNLLKNFNVFKMASIFIGSIGSKHRKKIKIKSIGV